MQVRGLTFGQNGDEVPVTKRSQACAASATQENIDLDECPPGTDGHQGFFVGHTLSFFCVYTLVEQVDPFFVDCNYTAVSMRIYTRGRANTNLLVLKGGELIDEDVSICMPTAELCFENVPV